MTAPGRLSRPLKLGYGIGSLGTGIFTTVPGLLLLFFLTDVLGVTPFLAGAAVLIPKLWDVVIDPAIGSMSDRARSRLGNRRPFMLAGGLALPVFFFALFAPPELAPGASALWVTVTFVLAATAFSLFQVPYIAMPTEATADRSERTRLVGYRMALLTVGILAGGGLAPLLVDLGGGGRDGYRVMGAVIGLMAGAAMVACTFGVRSARLADPVDDSEPLWTQLRRAARNRPFTFLLSGYFVQTVAVNAMLAAAPFFALYILGDEALTSVLFVALVGPAALAIPVWARLSFRIGKLASFQIAVAGFAVVAATMLTASQDRLWLVYLQAVLLGVFYGGTQLFPFSMLPDSIDTDTAETGVARAGSFTGLWTAGETTGAALGPFLFSAVLGITGFVESRGGVTVDQTAAALAGVRWGFAVLPAVILLASLAVVARYRLPEQAPA